MTKKLYGKTEEEIVASESLECRDIVKTILDYGVSQRQILHICKLLSLELEDTNAMKKISSLVNEFLDGKSTEDTQIII
tara:strand:- start:142 stop:378 length:237 start_codon:yes stop_codon:yes gene_type:complete